MEDSSFPTFFIDKENRILMANEAFCSFLGKDYEEIIGKACYEVVHTLKELPSFCPLCGKGLCILTGCSGKVETLCPYCPELKAPLLKGFYTREFFEPTLKKFLRVNLIPLYSDEDDLIGYIHFIEDKTKEVELHKLFEEVITNSFPGLCFINDEKFNLIYMNKTVRELCEENEEKCYQVIYGLEAPCEDCPMLSELEEGISEVYSSKLKRYFQRYFKKMVLSSGRTYKFTIYTDITEELRNFEEAAIALIVSTKDGKIIKANKRAREIFEIDTKEKLFQLKTLDFWVNSEDRERLIQKLLREGKALSFEAHLKTSKGKPFFALISSKVYQEKGELLIYSAIEDITVYLKAKEEAWRLLEHVMNFLPVGVAMIDKEDRCIFVNKKLLDITGYTLEELLGQNLHQLLIADSELRERALKVFKEIARGEKSVLARNRVEFLAKKKEGTTFLAEIYFDEIFLEGERYFIGTIQDITEKKRLEEKLLQEEKELAIEKIAGGLAHDLNNLLMIGKGFLEILEEKFKDFREREKVYVQKIREVFERIQNLVLELFILSKGELKKEEVIEIKSFLGEWVSFFLSGTKIRLNLEVPEEELFVPIQQSHLVSLVSNLVLNAREAMDNIGELTLRVYKEGDLAVLEFEDTGKGIPEEILDKIFEPGFSTKPHGSGLGLFVVKRIVENYKGEILVKSKVNEGSTFIIKLPLAKLKRREERKEVLLERKAPVEKRKILILDDEEDIRDLLYEFLSEQGYEVITFEEGDRAYEAFIQALEEKKPFHILLLDLTVPKGKGGVYLLKKLAEDGINLKEYKIILMTGYTEKELMKEAKEVEFNFVLYKPFSIQKLIEVLNL